jgi:hypothetical protein
LIDRIRHNMQHRLEELLAEAEKLKHALAALDGNTPAPLTTRTQMRNQALRAPGPGQLGGPQDKRSH